MLFRYETGYFPRSRERGGRVLHRHFPVELVGDPDKHPWPDFLNPEARIGITLAVLCSMDLIVTPLMSGIVGEVVGQYLVSVDGHQAKIAICHGDPVGIIYVLSMKTGPSRYDPEPEVLRAVAVHVIAEDDFSSLELIKAEPVISFGSTAA